MDLGSELLINQKTRGTSYAALPMHVYMYMCVSLCICVYSGTPQIMNMTYARALSFFGDSQTLMFKSASNVSGSSETDSDCGRHSCVFKRLQRSHSVCQPFQTYS